VCWVDWIGVVFVVVLFLCLCCFVGNIDCLVVGFVFGSFFGDGLLCCCCVVC